MYSKFRQYVIPMLCLLSVSVCTISRPADAQILECGTTEPMTSLGQPSHHKFQWGMTTGYSWDYETMLHRFFFDDHILAQLPQLGGLRFTAEAGIQGNSDWFGGSGALYATLFGVQNGVEYDSHREALVYRMAINLVARRGGLTGVGDRFRFEWVPASQTLQFGVTVNPPWEGVIRNRPKRDHAVIPTLSTGKIDYSSTYEDIPVELLNQIEHSIQWLDQFVTPNVQFDLDADKPTVQLLKKDHGLGDHIRTSGHTLLTEDSLYHASLDRGFSLASGGETNIGHKLSALAEKVILEEIIIPFNRLFGQNRKPYDFSGLSANAAYTFIEAIHPYASRMSQGEQNAVFDLFRKVVAMIAGTADNAKGRWNESRLVWLPLNYGLRRETYDSEDELNSVIERVLNQRFIDANYVRYVHNEAGYEEYKRLVLETQCYHVFHVHDFRGLSGGKDDIVAWKFVAEAYIQAFINAVEAIDRGEREQLPQFILFLDQHYYELNSSREIVTYIEHLYDPGGIDLDNDALEALVEGAQQKLRQVIANSPSMAALSKSELKRRFRVTVNITNIFEPTYSEDAIARDHRKLAFRDVIESDPGSGEAMFTGMGIGELYIGPCWEDRSIVVRGPALLALKDATRDLFLSQGIDTTDLPACLQPQELPANYRQLCDQLRAAGWTASVIDVFNQTGFGAKYASILKAILYNLMPPGSVLLTPDSLWACDIWASLLSSAALRGCHVFVIAPDQHNAPSAASVTLESIRKTLKSLLLFREYFGDELSQAGGTLVIGLYVQEFDVEDVNERLDTFISALDTGTPLTGRFSFDRSVRAGLKDLRRSWSQGNQPTKSKLATVDESCLPKLHLKEQCFLDSSALDFWSHPDRVDMFVRYFQSRRNEVLEPGDNTHAMSPGVLLDKGRHDPMAAGRWPTDAICITIVGSHNQDRRSMLLDGEALVCVSGEASLPGVVDIIVLSASVDWIDQAKEIDGRFPNAGGLVKALVRLIRDWI